MKSSLVNLNCLLLILAAGGCGNNEGRVAVHGTVTEFGEPLEEGTIQFSPAPGANGPAAGARIENGKFEIPARVGPGTGDYVVTVTDGIPRKKLKQPKRAGATRKKLQSYRFDVKISAEGGEFNFPLPPPARKSAARR